MNKLALIGKNISHSRSPEMYKKLISPSVDYSLLDYPSESLIPPAAELLQSYDGINITSPYKKHFLNDVLLTPIARECNAINCLKKENGIIVGENTDYLAIVEILKRLKDEFVELDVILLGDGVMSTVAQVALKNLNINFRVLSRKITKDFNHLNLAQLAKVENGRCLVINSCSREYVFDGILQPESLFWDFNYNFEEHNSRISKKVYRYFDGLEMLERQAFFAVAFWSRTAHS